MVLDIRLLRMAPEYTSCVCVCGGGGVGVYVCICMCRGTNGNLPRELHRSMCECRPICVGDRFKLTWLINCPTKDVLYSGSGMLW